VERKLNKFLEGKKENVFKNTLFLLVNIITQKYLKIK